VNSAMTFPSQGGIATSGGRLNGRQQWPASALADDRS
jgi:hypothetical protein